MKRHAEVEHDNKRWNCDVCNATFKTQSYIKKHMEMVHVGTKFLCDICERPYVCKKGLALHRMKHHA